MLHVQTGTFQGVSDDGFLIMNPDGPPVPVQNKIETSVEPNSDHPTVSESKKHKKEEELPVEEDNEDKKQKEYELVLPSDSNGVVYKIDGTTEVVDGPFDPKGTKLRKVIKCDYFQIVPCTQGDLKNKYQLWVNDLGLYENEINKKATELFGEQVYGKIYGNLLIVENGVVP
jgi:hypothetical protein